MNKIVRYLIIALIVFGVLFAAAYFIKSNSKATISYETATALITSIEKKTVATGKVIPEDEVEVKPQVQGILQALYVEEGDFVNEGDLLAKIKVVADEGQLNSAKGRLANTKIVLKNAEIEYNRNKTFLSKKLFLNKSFKPQNSTITVRNKMLTMPKVILKSSN